MACEEITSEVIKVFYKVYNTLGYGFLEKVYERAMCLEFGKSGIIFESQVPIRVFYDGDVVGDYVADFVVGEKVIVEIKALRVMSSADENQLLNYLTCTNKEVGLLLNFGEKAEIKRKVYDNELKKYLGGK